MFNPKMYYFLIVKMTESLDKGIDEVKKLTDKLIKEYKTNKQIKKYKKYSELRYLCVRVRNIKHIVINRNRNTHNSPKKTAFHLVQDERRERLTSSWSDRWIFRLLICHADYQWFQLKR